MDALFSEIGKRMTSRVAQMPYFSDKSYIPKEIIQDNFHPIFPADSATGAIVSTEKRQAAFIDGGSMEIAGNGSFSLSLVRIYHSIYEGPRRRSFERKDFLAYAYAEMKSGIMQFTAEIYRSGSLHEKMHFTLEDGNQRRKPESVIGSIRKVYESKEIGIAAASLQEGGIIVIDGSFLAKSPAEAKAIEESAMDAKKKRIAVCGVCKTSSIMADSGDSLVPHIFNLSRLEKEWYYHPICENENRMHQAGLFIARLHAKSGFAFLVEVHKDSMTDTCDIMQSLAMNSRDPVFLGYPYGLIDADAMARCSEDERMLIAARFMHVAGNGRGSMGIAIQRVVRSGTAHSILDSMR